MKDRHPPAQYAPDPAAHRQVPRTSNHRRGGARYTGCSEPADPRGTHPAHEWLRQSRLGHRSEGIILAALFTPLFPGVDCDDRPTANRHQPKLLPPDRAAPTAYTAFGSSPRCGSDARRFAPVSRSFSNGPPRGGGGLESSPVLVRIGPHRGYLVALAAAPPCRAPTVPPQGGPADRTTRDRSAGGKRTLADPTPQGGEPGQAAPTESNSTLGWSLAHIARTRFRYFELSLQSAFHRSITLLVRYRSCAGIRALRGVDLAIQTAVPRRFTRW